jgi:predicted small lipoprotein YifL
MGRHNLPARWRTKSLYFSAAVVATLCINGCGLKSGLYLPDDDTGDKPVNSAPVPPPPAAPGEVTKPEQESGDAQKTP